MNGDWRALNLRAEEKMPMGEAGTYLGMGETQDSDLQAVTTKFEDTICLRLPVFYRSAYRLLGNAADAEDAVQDALLSAHRHLNQFRGEPQLSTWLTSIVVNCARMKLRREPRHIHLSLNERIGEEQEYSLSEVLADPKPNPEVDCRNSELNERLREFTARLSPKLRRAFQLRDLDGLTTIEAARTLGVPVGTLKARLARARGKLREFMRQRVNSKSAARALRQRVNTSH